MHVRVDETRQQSLVAKIEDAGLRAFKAENVRPFSDGENATIPYGNRLDACSDLAHCVNVVRQENRIGRPVGGKNILHGVGRLISGNRRPRDPSGAGRKQPGSELTKHITTAVIRRHELHELRVACVTHSDLLRFIDGNY